MKILGKIDVDLDVVNKEYVDKIKNNLSDYATKEDLASVDVSGQLGEYAKREWVETEVIPGLMLGITDNIHFLFSKVEEKADKDHKHSITDINGLQDVLDDKASTTHTHTIDQIANLETRLNEISKMEGPQGPKGADGTSVTVEVVNSVPSNQAPNVIYLVKA